ncbi:glycoside hydrolase family 3 protein [Actinocorallia sp. A-T 12471]|uniref:glycoside hydrolase family 3 protein n=1 Tax=Actinocorallia sp. A-T 12471 TaxID=3089813 RepID=UPI0029CF5390|nr:glycoside hydrolase family 3 N-terminal domain-containing protein [Actinocorallia sp. A-T 12471]MDX6744553.1 glycoside hydrolase family 3 N-terminal domain-containing protein [Actinocorallia sp. A-T 12471]
MRTRISARPGARLTAVALAGCTVLAACSAGSGDGNGRVDQPTATPTPDPVPLAATLVAQMTVSEKVGQLLLPTVSDAAAGAKLVKDYGIGGFIYFPGNLKTPRKAAELSEALQGASKIPLLLGVDEETGIVSRTVFATPFPGAMALGATGDPELARQAALTTGAELKAVGVNLNFAPVADVNVDPRNPVIGVRSYGSDPASVGQFAAAAVDGYRTAGVAAVAKHFPGHGDTAVDSHTGLPEIDHTVKQWQELDRPPFQAAIEAGVDAIMTGHLVVPALDRSKKPATMSKKILTGVLREQMGFRGVIVTDSLSMAGAQVEGGAPEAAVRAVLAGADILLMPPDPVKTHAALLKAVKKGRISQNALDAAVIRVLTLKENRGLFAGTAADPAAAAAAQRTPEHRATALDVATRAVTVIRDKKVLPLKGKVFVTGPEADKITAALKAEGVKIGGAESPTHVVTSITPTSATASSLSALAGRRKVVAVVLGSPYGLRHTGDAQAAVATYSSSAVSLRGLAKVLTGKAVPQGRLPVDVPGGPDRGTGITAAL